MSLEFVGRGWAFPVAADDTGSIALVAGSSEIEQSIRLILGTAPGERPMRPGFGCRIHDFVFARVDSATAAQLGHEVRVSLKQWEPRITVEDVQVSLDNDDTGLFYIDIRYSVKSTNDPRNLVFPFYVIPAEG